MDTFTDIYLLDLHGNANKKERALDGGVDENVFDIRQGVSIALFAKEHGKRRPATVRHADLYGTRESKYEVLAGSDISTTNWETLEPTSPTYLFKPWDNELEAEYRKWPSINDVMPTNSSGVVTSRDDLTIHLSPNDLMTVVNDFSGCEPEEARNKYDLKPDVQDWKVQWAQVDLNETGIENDLVKPILYRPFDTRYTYYTGTSRGFICRPRFEVMRHVLPEDNLGLIFMRQVALDDVYSHIGISQSLVNNRVFYSNKGIATFAPLYIYPSEQEITQGLYEAGERQPNLAPGFTDDLEQRIGLRFVGDCKGNLRDTFGPEDVLHYIYAVFHSHTYRERYDQFLRSDFPRVPTPDSPDLFRALARIGRRLTDAHLMNTNAPSSSPIGFPVTGENTIEKAHPKYYAPGEKPPGIKSPLECGRVYISKSNRRSGKRGQYFDGIAPEIWEFRIGGYQPMHKWLQDRKGRVLSFEDLNHYRHIAASIEETILLMEDVDTAIIENGGLW